MLALLSLAGATWAADLSLAAAPDKIAAHHSTWAVYAGGSYAGMAQMDGMADKSGGATLVVRFVPPGTDQAAWVEGVSVDAQGRLSKVVHREGRRLRTTTVEGAVARDEVRDGGPEGTVIDQRELALPEGALTSPWLLPVLVLDIEAAKGDAWTGSVLDGAVLSPEPAVLTWQGRSRVGGDRVADLAVFARAGGAWTLVRAEGAVAAIQQPGQTQWVQAPRDQVEETHAQAGAARGR